MQSAVVNALVRAGARNAAAKSSATFTSRVALLSRGSFLVAPSYKARSAVHGYATATATRTRTTTTKKTADKKSPAAKKTAPKRPTASKKKLVAKKKAAPKKKATRPKRRALTEEEKKKAKKTAMRKLALLNKEPKQLPYTQWLVYMIEHVRGPVAGSNIKEVATQFKSLPQSEKQRLQDQADKNKITNAANYKNWVNTISVGDVVAANKARKWLRRHFPDVKVSPVQITDDRVPKRPAPAMASYIGTKMPRDGTGPERKAAFAHWAKEWSKLSAAEKKPFQDLYTASFAEYKKELQAHVAL